MKRLLVITVFSLLAGSSFAQGDLLPPAGYKKHRNEFGLDFTPFIKNLLPSDQFSNYYRPNYFLTYRRHFKSGNIRAAVGGEYNKADQSYYQNDSIKYYNTRTGLDFRIGWEFCSELNKRWQVFYGLDFRPSFTHDRTDRNSYDTGYVIGNDSKSRIYALAPVLGVRFRLTSRLSLVTEASFSINQRTSTSKQFFTPLSPNLPARPDTDERKREDTYTSFASPIGVIVTFDL